MELRKKQLQFLYPSTLIILYIYILHPFDKWYNFWTVGLMFSIIYHKTLGLHSNSKSIVLCDI